MASDFMQNAPIYMQILHDIRLRIASGVWPPGMRIPPVRELSIELGVNPNTAQRSLVELEREGLVFTERTSGRYITTDAALIQQIRMQMAAEATRYFCRQMQALGYSFQEIQQQIQQVAASEGESFEGDAFKPV